MKRNAEAEAAVALAQRRADALEVLRESQHHLPLSSKAWALTKAALKEARDDAR